MAPLGVSFSLLIEDQGLVKVDWFALLDPFRSNWFMLCPWAMSWGRKKLDMTERLSLHLMLASARLLQSCPALCLQDSPGRDTGVG